MCYSFFTETDLRKMSQKYSANIDEKSFMLYADIKKKIPKKFKEISEHPRVFPNYWVPILIANNEGNRLITPMRYRVFPSWSQDEISSKYNLFNARTDQLNNRKTWKNIFLKNHGIVNLIKFYEWVENSQTKKKMLVNFMPEDGSELNVPVIYDMHYVKEDEFLITSFAILTSEAPEEIAQAGHDRCPLFLKQEDLNIWLNPGKHSKQEILDLWEKKPKVKFICAEN